MSSRRNFLKQSGLSFLPAFMPAMPVMAEFGKYNTPPAEDLVVSFQSDGEFFDPPAYISKLQQINSIKPIERDIYSNGGAIASLEKKFAEITGKEKAIFMPTGTMANQLAIKVLCGENTKVFVQETSHVFRDEADAAQSVHNKRLIPLAKGETYFTADELQQSVDYHNQGEVFRSGIGAVSVENPVRRTEGKMVPIEEIRRIASYCKKNNYKLHLDGARLFMASAWSAVSIVEYASHFDTVYISLYKYLGAAAGAILCGDAIIIDKMPHLIKIYGGSMFSNWTNAAMALHKLEGLESRLKKARTQAEELFALLNQLPEIKINAIPGGTNIYQVQFVPEVNVKKAATTLAKDYAIKIGSPTRLTVNETLLYRDNKTILNAFKEALRSAKV